MSGSIKKLALDSRRHSANIVDLDSGSANFEAYTAANKSVCGYKYSLSRQNAVECLKGPTVPCTANGKTFPWDIFPQNPDLEHIYSNMEFGCRVSKVFVNRRGESSTRHCSIRRETRQLVLSKLSSSATAMNSSSPTGLHAALSVNDSTMSTLSTASNRSGIKSQTAVDLRLVKDVKLLEHKPISVRTGDKWKYVVSTFGAERVLIIHHGTQFVLGMLVLAFETTEICRAWWEGLNKLVRDSLYAPYPLLIERWLRKEFYAIVNFENYVTMKDLKPFIQQKLQFKITSRAIQSVAEENMGYEAFSAAYRKLVHVNQIFTDRFSNYSTDGKIVNFLSLAEFFINEQKDEVLNDEETCGGFLASYLRDIDVSRDVAQPYLSVHEFVDLLFSKENSIWDPRQDHVQQDMDQPLCNYWIASSHNTYLTGDQLKSESSLDAYSRALLMGCRCIELDVWDGQKKNSDSDIVVYHGFTMTTKLNLRDVLCTIRDYAFVTSEYPLILSIEDNCSVNMQRHLAQYLKEILGEYLLTAPVDKDEKHLPSPEVLKRRIIIKHKKLTSDSERDSFLDDSFQDQDILSKPGCMKKGLLELRDGISGEWFKHIFVLFSDRLCFTADKNLLLTMGAYDLSRNQFSSVSSVNTVIDDEGQEVENSQATPHSNTEELHLTEDWFHGKIGRDDAVNILLQHKDLGDGLFLVRESTTFVGDYSLSFLHTGVAHHCRIRTSLHQGAKQYFLLDSKKLDTLYELIGYYQEHPLTTPKFRARLVTSCPQPQPHVSQPWFAGDVDRAAAEDMLNAHPLDGSFLIRQSEAGDGVFTLSFRVDGVIIHARLKQEGRMFMVCTHEFESLILLVDYYKEHELYHGVCLRYPVNRETIENYSKDVSHAPQGCYLDLRKLQPTRLMVKAVKAFVAQDAMQLTFPVGARMTITDHNNEHWWKGTYGTLKGFIPADHVKIIECTPQEMIPTSGIGSKWIDLNKAVIEPFNQPDKDHAFKVSHFMISNVDGGRELVMAAESQEDMHDWINSMHESVKSANDKYLMLRSREKCMRIASELSNLVIYCQAVQFDPDHIPGYHFEMISFSDSKIDKYIERGLGRYNLHQLSRVYPNASRFTSANFDPLPMWCAGCHMVALNYQTDDKPMQLNQARFSANGKCGFVLKPYCLRQAVNLDAERALFLQSKSAVTITIEVIAGRHLSRREKNGKGIVSPAVEVEILGLSCDNFSRRTRPVSCDGLHPVWEERFVFEVAYPELALIRFNVEEADFVTADPFIGQATFPIDCLRTGYRSVPLRNASSEELELSSLLVHFDMRQQDPSTAKLSKHSVALAASCSVQGVSLNDRTAQRCNSTCETAGKLQPKNGLKVEKTHSTPVFALGQPLSRSASQQDMDSAEGKKKSSFLKMFKKSKQ